MESFQAKLLISAGFLVLVVIDWSFHTNAAPVDFVYDEEINTREHIILNLAQELSQLRNSISDKYNTTTSQALGTNLLRLLATISSVTSENQRANTSILSNNDALPLLAQLFRDAFGGNITGGTDSQVPSNGTDPSIMTKLKHLKKLSPEEITNLEAELKYIRNIRNKSSRRNEQPRGIFENLMKVMTDLGKNMTNHNASAPTPPIIQGAMGAVNVLNRLGLLEPITDFIHYEIEFLSNDY